MSTGPHEQTLSGRFVVRYMAAFVFDMATLLPSAVENMFVYVPDMTLDNGDRCLQQNML